MPARTRFRERLPTPTDAASLAVFRVMFGVMVFAEALWGFHAIHSGRWPVVYDPTAFHFTYLGLGWVRPPPLSGLYALCGFAAVAALGLILGAAYRLCAAGVFLASTYLFLMENSSYLNHHYLICLVAFLMIFIPARGAPAWGPWLLRVQFGLVYFFGGLAKLNADWLAGWPLKKWIAGNTITVPFCPPLPVDGTALFLSWSGLILDLAIVPLLLWRRTRYAAFALAVAFHLLNARIFGVGAFPWLMLAGTLLFLAPERPAAIPRAVPALVWLYLGVQVGLPLRHFLYPGNVSWTEEGHQFSWHMLLRSKEGTARVFASDPVAGTKVEIDPRAFLKEFQVRRMAVNPDLILQFARHLAGVLVREKGWKKAEIRVKAEVSLNGRKPQLLIDPEVDLAAQPRDLGPKPWILPLTEPLPGG